jgi:hypothetical protein
MCPRCTQLAKAEFEEFVCTTERWRTTKIPNAVRRLIIALRAVESE